MLSGFQLAKLPSIYNNKTVLNEYITDNRLASLIQHNIGVEFSADNYHRKTHGFVCEQSQNKMMLSKYNKKEGCFKIKLENNKHGWGRIKTQDHATLSVMYRPTRHSLCQGTYIDIDIHSCCQTIYLNIIRNNGIEDKFPRLKEYVENRNDLLVHYQSKYGCNRDTIKNLFTLIGFGGSANKWFRTKNIENDNDVFIAELNAEYYNLSRIIYDANPQIIKDVLKADPNRFSHKSSPEELLNSKMRTTIALFYQTAERYCQEAVISFLCSAKNFNLKDIVPCQDGFMILQELYYDTICDDATKIIKNKFGFDLEFLIKEFDERFEIPKYITDKEQQQLKKEEEKQKKEQEKEEEKQKKEDEKIRKKQEKINNIEMMQQLAEEAEQQKIEEEEEHKSTNKKRIEEFEETHIKIINKGVYLIELENSTTLLKTKKQLVESYEHLQDVIVCGMAEKFINFWTTNNPSIRSKDDIAIYPDNSKCPSNHYNLWKPFAGELLPAVDKQDDEVINFFRNHILILCNNDKGIAEYFENWIGQMIQYPDIKTNCPILISSEGAGKGTLLLLLKKMIGANKYLETTNPSRDVWGGFNSLMTDKYLVNVNELSKSDTVECMGKIKGLISDYELTINPKGIAAYEIQSYHRFIITTNNLDPIKTEKDDRRFWLIRSSDELCKNKEYFKKCYDYLKDPNVIKIMYEYFKNIKNLENFAKLEKPLTEYQKNIQEQNISPIELWLESFTLKHQNKDVIELTGTDALKYFETWKEQNKVKYDVNATKLGVNLTNLNIDGIEKGRHTNKGKTKYFNIPKLKKYFSIGCLVDFKKNNIDDTDDEEDEPNY